MKAELLLASGSQETPTVLTTKGILSRMDPVIARGSGIDLNIHTPGLLIFGRCSIFQLDRCQRVSRAVVAVIAALARCHRPPPAVIASLQRYCATIH